MKTSAEILNEQAHPNHAQLKAVLGRDSKDMLCEGPESVCPEEEALPMDINEAQKKLQK